MSDERKYSRPMTKFQSEREQAERDILDRIMRFMDETGAKVFAVELTTDEERMDIYEIPERNGPEERDVLMSTTYNVTLHLGRGGR